MAQTKIKTPANVVERNLLLTEEIIKYLLNNPQTFSVLPEKFELVILPENDPEMRLYNLDLLDEYREQGEAVVFAQVTLKSPGKRIALQNSPNLYAPVAIAA